MHAASSGTTALSSVSRMVDGGQDRFRVTQVAEHRVRSVLRQRFHRVVTGSDGNRPGTNRAAALDIARRVTHDHHRAPLDVQSKALARPALRNAGQLGTDLVVRTKRTNSEAAEADTGRGQLVLRPRLEVAGQEANDTMVPMHQGVEQLHNAGERLDAGV